ncbi:MAG: hypothetical protein ABIV51_10695 [Saprospiraceae bacterium]
MRIPFVFVFLLFLTNLPAQVDTFESARVKAYIQIKDLHEGILVFRLPSEKKKLEAYKLKYEGKMESTRYDKLVESTKAERDLDNRAFIEAFQHRWTICPVYFIYDYDTPKLLNNEKVAISLDSNLVFRKDIIPYEKSLYIAEFTEFESGMEAMHIMDFQLNNLKAPFPHYYRVNDNWKLFLSILFPKQSVKKDPEISVRRWNKSLNRFLLRANKAQ